MPSQVDFYRLPGVENPQDFMFLTGNPPEPTAAQITFAIAAGVGLAVGAVLLQRMARRIPAGRLMRGFVTLNLVAWFFLTWELLLTVYAYGHPFQVYVPDPILFWKRNPELVRRALMVDPAQAFKGTAGAGLPDGNVLPPRPGTRRVLFLGDSQLLSTTPSAPGKLETYPIMLARRWRAKHGGTAEMLNGGVPGYSTFQALYFLRHVGLGYHPDTLVLACAYHDSNLSFSPDADVLTDSRWLQRVRTAAYSSEVYLMLRRQVIRRQAAEYDPDSGRASYRRVAPEAFRANLLAIGELARQNGIRLILVTEPVRQGEVAIQGRMDPYWGIVREIGPTIGTVLDAEALLPPGGRRLFSNDVHFTATGHAVMADLLEKVL